MIKPDSAYGPPAHELPRRPPSLNEFGIAPPMPESMEPQPLPQPPRARSIVNFLDFDNALLLYKGVTVPLLPFQLNEFKKLAAYFAIQSIQEDLQIELGPQEPEAAEGSD